VTAVVQMQARGRAQVWAALGVLIPGRCGRLTHRGRGAEISTRTTVGATTGDPSHGWGLRVCAAGSGVCGVTRTSVNAIDSAPM